VVDADVERLCKDLLGAAPGAVLVQVASRAVERLRARQSDDERRNGAALSIGQWLTLGMNHRGVAGLRLELLEHGLAGDHLATVPARRSTRSKHPCIIGNRNIILEVVLAVAIAPHHVVEGTSSQLITTTGTARKSYGTDPQ